MLLITRRQDESVIINGDIEVKIVDVRGNRVKLGFEFPDGSTVYRKELYLKIQEENKAAAEGGPDQLLSAIQSLGKPSKGEDDPS
ncbi:MAG: carbon storage regulator CsrA [Alphaproteobacteria bacterium]|jgi:carbon storage regulator|nr:carbon storage regulator CsrA [Alphaproteobacteria bacterium]